MDCPKCSRVQRNRRSRHCHALSVKKRLYSLCRC
nr:MAG TPA: leader polypeptide [Caudoviricetes sp.]